MKAKHAAWRFGLWAEYLCAALLLLKGYRILALRVRTGGGEIDILARRGNTLVVVEVKARNERTHDHTAALYSVTPAKQQRLVSAARYVMAGKIAGLALPPEPNIRFDVMAVRPWAWPLHIRDAWRL